ncbi:MAG: single-stranded DNA-binding protein [Pseudonocardia sp.]|nr:single-stranded DNA-binding protein [Pseudonocardia sp.]
MYETVLTAVGRVATAVSGHRFDDGVSKASFRLACTERRREWGTGNWVDGETLFMTVICWRSLAENVQASLRVGDPVVVRGRMRTREFEIEGRRATNLEMEAAAIGPDLSRCTTVVTRTSGGAVRSADASAVGDLVGASAAGRESGEAVSVGSGGEADGRR